MTRYDVNLSILFTELPLLQRPAAAAAAGFDAVELWWPFADPVPADRDVDALVGALDDAGTRLVGLNFDAGDMAGGDRGLLSVPEWSARFRANVDATLAIAERTGCLALNALYGNRVDAASAQEQDELGAENLALAARAASRIGAVVLLEALNAYESPRYPLVSAASAVGVVERVQAAAGVDNLRFLCDLYHLGRMGEDLDKVITTYADRIGHVQVADIPGRHQPGTGKLDVAHLLGLLEEAGYGGYVGLEYAPAGPSADSFDWLPREQRPSHRKD
jgi:hydroxypyruvate isomerase